MKDKNINLGNQKGLLWIALGLLLIAAALLLTSYNLYNELHAEQASKQMLKWLEDYLPSEGNAEANNESAVEQEPSDTDDKTAIPNYVICPNMEMRVEVINGVGFIGILQIPVVDMKLPIISEWNYPNLKKAPCRYSGSVYMNNLIICGHNNFSQFGKLKKLHEGDIAIFTDMDGNVFTYKMVEWEILQSTDIEKMKSGDWDLTLFACTAGGVNRLTIRFELEKD